MRSHVGAVSRTIPHISVLRAQHQHLTTRFNSFEHQDEHIANPMSNPQLAGAKHKYLVTNAQSFGLVN